MRGCACKDFARGMTAIRRVQWYSRIGGYALQICTRRWIAWAQAAMLNWAAGATSVQTHPLCFTSVLKYSEVPPSKGRTRRSLRADNWARSLLSPLAPRVWSGRFGYSSGSWSAWPRKSPRVYLMNCSAKYERAFDRRDEDRGNDSCLRAWFEDSAA